MEELISQLGKIGFPDEFLKTVEEQHFTDVDAPNIDDIEYSVYDEQVNYTAEQIYRNK